MASPSSWSATSWMRWRNCATAWRSSNGGGSRRSTPRRGWWTPPGRSTGVLVGAFTMLGQKTEEQNLARKQMITELAEASHRLEEMIAENTGLQAQLVT